MFETEESSRDWKLGQTEKVNFSDPDSDTDILRGRGEITQSLLEC